MDIDKRTRKNISEASTGTANPERAERNLIRFAETNPDVRLSPLAAEAAAKLFAVSQFLANFCIANPAELLDAFRARKTNISKSLLQARAEEDLDFGEQPGIPESMKSLRLFKKRCLLKIALRDVCGETDIQSSMDELTRLAETIISAALACSVRINRNKFGPPSDSAIAVIALGKLGGEELNFSSDVDVMAVYDNDEGQTAGAPNPSGVVYNRISNHEFYCKVVELFNKLLSSQTEDGIAYRVDLRLRPQGQKGDIVLPLRAYRTYYESWGRTWERMVLVRARPVAGDASIGAAFMETVRPFVWRESLDYSEIEEIRGLKKKIDSTYSRDDIKRGYGGIREAEFFIQTFQLLFGGANSSLRSYRILNAIQALKWMKKVPGEDLTSIWENYLYLRRVEHYLQMKEDLQTHTLPSADDDMNTLSAMMGFPGKEAFLQDLRVRRMQIKSMYNSLLGTEQDVHDEVLNLLEGGLTDSELEDYLTFRKLRHPRRGVARIRSIAEHMRVFHTMHERSVARQIVPGLLESALMSENPDSALAGIDSLITSYRIKTAHLTALLEFRELMNGIIKIFALSPYLTSIFLSSQYYLDILIEEWSIFKSRSVMEGKLARLDRSNAQIARYRRFEEVRFGILFLLKIITTEDLFRGLSQLAGAILEMLTGTAGNRGLAVIALGKLGGREITFGSDLDIVFVSESPDAMPAAEKIIKLLTSYTDMGILYQVDTRLRPDGSRGVLANNVEGYRNYYLKNARNWEIQALLKARPVAGDGKTARDFINMAKEVILLRGGDMKRSDISEMRQRIIKEASHESEGIDIKLGPGGIEEIEFFIQYLQLSHAGRFPEILVQNTLTAINRLAKKDILDSSAKEILRRSYEYFRKLQTFMRMNEKHSISGEDEFTPVAAKFMGHTDPKDFLDQIHALRDNVLSVTGGA